ncbi:hypothetical protein O181_010778 [Austropuccinia psidii MF-1]|uniref:Uncharacterized protein n=1 Tax=Austropuccinia psidii MF-1 TaxID=1389203 RepID=A0A9Q3BTN6_9BASI|nr:hypothetical protein [Austropuccinia psidii MF-1]
MERDQRQLSQLTTQCWFLTMAQIMSFFTKHVLMRTIQQEIHKLSKASRISPKKPFLQPQDFQPFLALSQEHQCWTINHWEKVVWTDKSAFELGKRAHQVQLWGKPQEKWLLKNLAVKP